MTLEEIKKLMPVFERWKLNIALIYGDRYAELYCTWERFRDHLQVLEVMENEKKENPVEVLLPESIRSALREKQKEIFREGFTE